MKAFVLCSLLVTVMSGCGMIPSAPNPEVDGITNAFIASGKIDPGYSRAILCGGYRYINNYKNGVLPGTLRIGPFTVSTRDEVLTSFTQQESIVIDYSSPLVLSIQDKRYDVKSDLEIIPKDSAPNYYTLDIKNWVEGNSMVLPIGGAQIVLVDIQSNSKEALYISASKHPAECAGKRIVFYTKVPSAAPETTKTQTSEGSKH